MTHAPMLGALSSMLTSAGTSVKPGLSSLSTLTTYLFQFFMPPCTLQSPYLFALPTNACMAWYGMAHCGIADWQLAFALYTHIQCHKEEVRQRKREKRRGGQAKAEAAKHPSFH